MDRAQLIAQAKRKHLIKQAKAKHAATQNQPAPEDTVIDEMHPDISTIDRFMYKSFQGSPEEGLAQLQKSHPNLEMKLTKDGPRIRRKGEETDWRKLDPSKSSVKEFLRDGLDLGWDVADGLATTASTIGGGLLGSALGPAGTVAGGVAGSTLGSLGMEGLRQGVGNLSGHADGVDTTNLAIAGGAGALSPLLMGQGSSAKTAMKHFSKQGLTGDVLKNASTQFAQQGRGLIPKAAGKVGNAVTENLGAVANGHTARMLRKVKDKVRDGVTETGLTKVANNFRETLTAQMKTAQDFLGVQKRELLGKLDVKLDTKSVEEPFQELLTSYRKKAFKDVPNFETLLKRGEKVNKASVDNYLYLKEAVEKVSKDGRALEGEDIIDFRTSLKDLAQLQKNANVSKKLTVDKDLITAAKRVGGNLQKQLDTTPSGRAFRENDDAFSAYYDDAEVLKRYVKDDSKAASTLTQFESKSGAGDVRKTEMQGLGETYGVDVNDAADDAYVLQQFFNPADSASHRRGTAATARAAGLSGIGSFAGYAVGQRTGPDSDISPWMGAALGASLGSRAGSDAAIKNYIKVGNAARKAATASAPARRVGREVLWENLLDQQYQGNNQ